MQPIPKLPPVVEAVASILLNWLVSSGLEELTLATERFGGCALAT
jgi:hypothetical protein